MTGALPSPPGQDWFFLKPGRGWGLGTQRLIVWEDRQEDLCPCGHHTLAGLPWGS